MNTLTPPSLKPFLLLLTICLWALPVQATKIPSLVELQLASGEVLKVRLAISLKQQSQGLSGVKSADFGNNEAMLFFYPRDGERSFWMPDTYFDLDIFFLSKNFEVESVARSVPHHPGRKEPPKIARTPTVYSRHVLEMKSSSPLAKKIKVGQRLIWKSKPAPWQIEQEIRRGQ